MKKNDAVCAKHQTPLRRLGVSMICPTCMAERSAPKVQGMGEREQRNSMTKVIGLLAKANIPQLFREASFRNFDVPNPRAQKLVDTLEMFVNKFGEVDGIHGFLFLGPPGTGKTHIACAMVSSLVMQGIEARYASIPTITMECRKAQKGFSQSVYDIVNEYVAPAFLVLDEIDVHAASDADYQVMFEIINRRYESNLITLAISNRPIEELNRDLNERVIGRILGGNQPIRFDWPSHRDKPLNSIQNVRP